MLDLYVLMAVVDLVIAGAWQQTREVRNSSKEVCVSGESS